MKKELLVLAVFASVATATSAQHVPPPDWNGTPEQYRQHQARLSCTAKGEIFKSAAQFRDRDASPETAYKVNGQWVSHKIPGITRDFIKNAVNAVYFDPAFSNARGPLLSRQIENLCLNNGKPRFQPLK